MIGNLFLFLLAVSPTLVLVSSLTTYQYQYIRQVDLPALAVSSSGEGVVSRLTIKIAYPGSGEVYFSSEPLSMIDSQASARIAVMVASQIAGVNRDNYDFFISMKSPSLIIGGPSAGGVMTIGVLAALLNIDVNNTVAMTGMILPDGTIGPVGGIPSKLRAAAEAGYKVLLIPAGQSIVYEEKVKRTPSGIGVITRITREKVNVTALGEKLGIKVIEVADIDEAAKYFLGIETGSNKNLTSTKITYTGELESLYQRWIENMTKIRESIKQTIKHKDVVSEYINQSDILYQKALELENNKKYYTAASFLFQSLTLMQEAWVLSELDSYEKIQAYITNINSTIKELEKKINTTEIQTLSQLEAAIIARERLSEAKENLEKGVESIVQVIDIITGKKRIQINDPEALALAYTRLLTVKQWMEYSELPSPKISSNAIKSTAQIFMDYAEDVVSYYDALSSDVGFSQQTAPQDYYAQGQIEYQEKEYVKAITDFMRAISSSITRIHLLFDTAPEKITNILLERALKLLSIEHTYQSGIAIGYYELGEEYLQKFKSTGDNTYLYNSIQLAILSSLYSTLSKIILGYSNNTSIQTSPTSTTSTSENTSSQQTTTRNSTETQLISKTSGELLGKNEAALLIVLVVLALLYYIYRRS